MDNQFVQLLLGFLFGIQIPYGISVIKPEWFVKLVVQVLLRYQKDDAIKNKISNQLGQKLVDIGTQLITYYPDDQQDNSEPK